MPVDFFTVPCSNPVGNCNTAALRCLQEIHAPSFGISNKNGGVNMPATVNTVDPDPSCDLLVHNHSGTPITFKAVDWCTPIFRTGTYDLDDPHRTSALFSSDSMEDDLITRCEGFLVLNRSIIFIEIKNRGGGRGWIKDSREKFEETILSFREHHPEQVGHIAKPILCNPSFARVHQSEAMQKKILKDKVGLEFLRKDSITI